MNSRVSGKWIAFHSVIALAASLVAVASTAVGAELQMSVSPDAGGIRISYPSEQGVTYQLERSTNLADWQAIGPFREGTGSLLVEDPIPTVDPNAFFRVASNPSSTDLSPSPERMAELLVGTNLLGYRFTSTNRFRWFSEAGNWRYTKAGPDTGVIVFTYDEDDNDPLIYREEAILTFLTPTSGTGRYSEWIGNVEDPGSVGTFTFDLGSVVTAVPPAPDR